MFVGIVKHLKIKWTSGLFFIQVLTAVISMPKRQQRNTITNVHITETPNTDRQANSTSITNKPINRDWIWFQLVHSMTKNWLSSKLERDRNRKVIYLLRNARTLSPREVFQLTPECANTPWLQRLTNEARQACWTGSTVAGNRSINPWASEMPNEKQR